MRHDAGHIYQIIHLKKQSTNKTFIVVKLDVRFVYKLERNLIHVYLSTFHQMSGN